MVTRAEVFFCFQDRRRSQPQFAFIFSFTLSASLSISSDFLITSMDITFSFVLST